MKLISDVGLIAPPFFIMLADSGQINTLNPIWVSFIESSVMAVVFPAQGPPVMQILVI